MSVKNLTIFENLSINTKDKAKKEIEKYLNESEYSLHKLSDNFNKITEMKTNRKSISKLIIELGYEGKNPDLVKLSKIKNASEDMRFKSEKQLKEKEEYLLSKFDKSAIIKSYYSGKSIVQIEKDTGISVYYLNLIFESWDVKLRPLPKTGKEVILELNNNGYDREKLIEQYHGNNLTMKEFVNFISSVISYPVTERMGERIVQSEKLHKPSSKVKENRGKKTKQEFNETILNIQKSGFYNIQEIADFFHNNKSVTYFDMVKILNDNLNPSDKKFNVRWLERHMMPLLPADRLIGVSRLELSVKDYISTLIPEKDFECSNRKIIGPFELDFYFPKLNIAIEVNGLYWHSEKFGKDKNYHYDKWKKCADKGIQLITVWEDDWNLNRPVVEKVIAHKLGVFSSQKIGARKTYVDSQISFNEASEILNNNHIQGSASGSHYFGLRDKSNDNLIAVMVVKRSFKTVDSVDVEIVRYGTDKAVQGGFTKLLKHVVKEFSPNTVTTFSDNEISNGGLYERHGFEKVYELKPDYKYIVGGERKHKFLFRKDRFKSNPDLEFVDGLTERELADLNGLYRVYDSGKMKWVKCF